ncbi:MAG: hypothetical protein AAF750_17670 [Planctomycetota bacterium]
MHGEFEPWVEFFLQGVYEVARQATDTAKAITALRERDRTRLVEVLNKGAGTGLAVFEELFKLPVISVNQAAKIGGVTYAPANALIAKLESLGILQEITGRGRNRLFMYGEYFRLLQDDPTAENEKPL